MVQVEVPFSTAYHGTTNFSPRKFLQFYRVCPPAFPAADYYNEGMSRLALVYGLRMLPAEELAGVGEAEITLQNGKTTHVAMHLLEGNSEEELRQQLLQSLDAFFEFYPQV